MTRWLRRNILVSENEKKGSYLRLIDFCITQR